MSGLSTDGSASGEGEGDGEHSGDERAPSPPRAPSAALPLPAHPHAHAPHGLLHGAGAGSALAQLQHLLLTQHGAHSLLLHTQVSQCRGRVSF